MLIFVACYVAAVVIAFTAYLIRYKKKDERRKFNNAAERIVREDMLRYSLRNPYADTGNKTIPATRRKMICITIKTGGKKQRYVFDPEKRVNIGRSDKNQLIIYDSAVSEQNACIYSSMGKICIYHTGSGRKIILVRGGKRKAIPMGSTAILHDRDKVLIGKHELLINLFLFDFNHK